MDSVRYDRLRSGGVGVPGTASVDAGDGGESEAEHDTHHAHPRRRLPRMLDALLRHLPLVSKLTFISQFVYLCLQMSTLSPKFMSTRFSNALL